MAVLVTGGSGYIGSHVCKALFESGRAPIIYDNRRPSHEWGLFVQGDILDDACLQKTFQEHQPQAVIHLASLINVRDSITDPFAFYRNNFAGSLTLLKAMVSEGVLNLIFSSTAAIYGTPQYSPLDEKHPKLPLNAYGKTKWGIEGMLEDFSQAYGLQYAALRYFNACGADASGLIGEEHDPETHLIPVAIRTAMGLQEALLIYGNDHPTPDGTAIRDYVHVTDLAKAHLSALAFILKNQTSIQVNLGTGKGYSVQEIIQAIEAFSGKKIPTAIRPKLPQDSPVLVADYTSAKTLLGWHPDCSDLHTIIESAWKWHEKESQREQSSKKLLKTLQGYGRSLSLN